MKKNLREQSYYKKALKISKKLGCFISLSLSTISFIFPRGSVKNFL